MSQLRSVPFVGPAVAALFAVGLAAPCRAEIVDLRASVQTHVTEFRQDKIAGEESAFDSFPDTSDLPLKVLAFVTSRPDYPAAGSSAAAVNDPAESIESNPGEFAINFSLNTASGDVRYAGNAVATEERDIVFQPADVGGKSAGTRATLAGRLFLDGALAMYSPVSGQDLTGNQIVWHVRVTQKSALGIEAVAFDGTLELIGGPAGSAEVRRTGDFPDGRITFSTVPDAENPFPAFNIAVVPALSVDYTYDAIVGEQFTLIATVEVTAANTPGLNGVTAIVGAPVDALQTVIDATFGAPTGPALLRAVERERETPTGVPAFTPTLPGACGLFGVESLALACGGLLLHVARRRRVRSPAK